MLSAGQQIDLTIEKPAAGGRMIARHEGQVVLVAGAVPGERVRARVEKSDRRLAFAHVVDVADASPDRRAAFSDPLCGGCVYSHISYPRQLRLKSDVIRDAFQRIGRVPLEADVDVAPSPELGYRMRARLHVSRGRVGFYREGTHALCDPESTGQLMTASLTAVRIAVELLEAAGVRPSSIELTENLSGTERAFSIAIAEGSSSVERASHRIVEGGAARGAVIRDGRGQQWTTGQPSVSDPLNALTRGRASGGDLRRHADSFFQANRYLVPALVAAVLDEIRGDRVVDLYAGVGLFAVALAATVPARTIAIVAVEGDRASGADLQLNAGSFGGCVTLALQSVEDYLQESPAEPSTVIVDPPRTGISSQAIDALARRQSPRIVYVSCDPATLARDTRKLLDAGYTLSSLRAFDLFPNTAHVESVAVFDV